MRRKLDAEGELDAEEAGHGGSSRGGSWTWRGSSKRKLKVEEARVRKLGN